MKNVLLSAVNLSKTFSSEDKSVLKDVTVDFYEGDFTVIMGSSGAGKSTLLHVLSGMDRASSGKVVYKGQEIQEIREKQMAKLRTCEFGFVFQQTHLVSNLSLYENIAVAGYLGNKTQPKMTQEMVKELLTQMNLGSAGDRLPSEVSGGEAQRAAVARAVINRPAIVFADEPTGALNRQNTEDVLDILSRLSQAGQSILMVTHDLRAALRGNRILYLDDGQITGEMELPVYEPGTEKERETQLNSWLSSMEW